MKSKGFLQAAWDACMALDKRFAAASAVDANRAIGRAVLGKSGFFYRAKSWAECFAEIPVLLTAHAIEVLATKVGRPVDTRKAGAFTAR